MSDDMWGTGNFHAVSEKIQVAGEALVEAAGIEPGQAVRDVGCGTRNAPSPPANAAGRATIPAAARGAPVTGLDTSPGLTAVAREEGADAIVEVDWIVGDAQSL